MTRRILTAAILALLGLNSNVLLGKTWVAFGDSITEGDSRWDEEGLGGYPGRLQKILRSAGEAKAVVRNEGIGSEDSLESQRSIVGALNRGGDVLLLMIGTNDITQVAKGNRSIETVRYNLDELRKKATSSGMDTVMATIIHRKPNAKFDRFNTFTWQLVAAIRELQSKNNRQLADVFEAFERTTNRFNTLYTLISADPIGHPNAAGFQLIAETFADIILGNDTLEPLIGSFTKPGFNATEVGKKQEFELVLYDHASGFNRGATTFLINRREVDTEVISTGDRKKATLKFKLSKFKDCGVLLEVLAQDRADPPNVLDRLLGEYKVKGRGRRKSDIDFDCRVDGVDLVIFAFHFGAERGDPRYDSVADINNDGLIDGEDLGILAQQFGRVSS